MAEKFLLVGTRAQLPEERNANTLYWCYDTRELYKGMDLYTEAVRIVTELPTAPATGVAYILPTGEVQVYDGTNWSVMAYPYVVDGLLSETNTAAEVPTAKVVFDSIADAVANATVGGEIVNNIVSTTAGTLTITKGESTEDVAIAGVVVTPTYDATTRTITLPYADGSESLVINLGKDVFVDASANNGYNPDTGNIELWLNDGSVDEDGNNTSTLIAFPAAALIDIYTGGTTSSATVAVDNTTNVITADVKVSLTEGNRVTVNDDGLMVDVSDLGLKSVQDELVGKVTTLEADSDTEGSVDYKVAQQAALTLADANAYTDQEVNLARAEITDFVTVADYAALELVESPDPTKYYYVTDENLLYKYYEGDPGEYKKINAVADPASIVDDLVTADASKALSANQGVELKAQIDGLIWTGTKAEYEIAKENGEIKPDQVVNITDDDDLITIDNVVTQGSNNAVASNAVYEAVAVKADIESPEFTGVPTAPTAVAGTSTTQIATTEFVSSALTSGVTSKIVTELTATSTDEEIPSAKAVYDLIKDIQDTLSNMMTEYYAFATATDPVEVNPVEGEEIPDEEQPV